MKTHTSASFCFFSYHKAQPPLPISSLSPQGMCSLVGEDAVCQLQWCLPYHCPHFSAAPSISVLIHRTVGLSLAWYSQARLSPYWMIGFLAHILVLLSLVHFFFFALIYIMPIYTAKNLNR